MMERRTWLDGREWCEHRMANDYKRMSGRVCGLTPGHPGPHKSSYAIIGEALRKRGYAAT
jgi:hypothetical protein